MQLLLLVQSTCLSTVELQRLCAMVQVATLYTLWQMCALHQVEGRRFNRYHELGQYALGKFRICLSAAGPAACLEPCSHVSLLCILSILLISRIRQLSSYTDLFVMSCRSSGWAVDRHPLSADCHDWAGHCVLCDCRAQHEVPVPAHLQRVEGAHLHLLRPLSLDRHLCHHPDLPLHGKPVCQQYTSHFSGLLNGLICWPQEPC